MVTVHVTVGSRVRETCFFVVRTGSSYNALLGRDWIHANKCVPSSMHQYLQMLDEGNNVQIITADPCPFNAEIHNAEARLYSGNIGPLSTPLKTKCVNMLVKTEKESKPIMSRPQSGTQD